MKNKIAKIMIITGIVCVVASLSLFIYNRAVSSEAARFASQVVTQLRRSVVPEPDTPQTERDDVPDSVSVSGSDFIGYLSIPSLRLDLPVMSEWSYENLNRSPCRYSGSPATDDFVIAAHNYSSHFGFISSLKVGDTVNFTDVHAKQTDYTVELVDTLSPTAVEDMTSGEYDLTLFTCTYSGQARVTVRLNKIQN